MKQTEEKKTGGKLKWYVLGALILCTASLVDAGYNPFLYFRF